MLSCGVRPCCGQALSQQTYACGRDNPLNFVDPTGLSAIGDVFHAFSSIGNVDKKGVDFLTDKFSSGVNFGWHHPGDTAGVIAGGVCVGATEGGCAVALGLAFAAAETGPTVQLFNGDIRFCPWARGFVINGAVTATGLAPLVPLVLARKCAARAGFELFTSQAVQRAVRTYLGGPATLFSLSQIASGNGQ